MHPIDILFEDIYRNHWGIPQRSEPRREAPVRVRWPRLKAVSGKTSDGA